MEADTPQSTRELAVKFDVTISPKLNHLKRIGKIWKLGRWILHRLKERQKRSSLEAYLYLLTRH